MPRRPPAARRFATAARWPGGIALTAWRYLWRTTPVHRWELSGSTTADEAPALPAGIDRDEIQTESDGVGPMLHRLYRTQIRGAQLSPEELMTTMTEDLDRMAPSTFATFQKMRGADDRIAVDDDYIVRMPGPWDGPVRVVDTTPTSFRLATLDGHLEAGQIEFRAWRVDGKLEVVIESWARSGDRLSNVLYTHLPMAKEVQLLMWTTVLEAVVEMSGGHMHGGIVVTTRFVSQDSDDDASGTGLEGTSAQRRLAELASRSINFGPTDGPTAPDDGWHVDDMTASLPPEASGAPVEGGSWNVAKDLMLNYQVANPATVRASYAADAPLAGRNMLLEIRFGFLRFHVGVRVGDVYEETLEVDGATASVFGWSYSTLEGHFERGRMHYEVWKWHDKGDVEFRLHAFSRVADSGPWLTRTGFRLLGRNQQAAFYRDACRRMRRLTESQLEAQRTCGRQSEAV